MYSGFIKSNKNLNNNLFYWLFMNNDASKPLIIWLNGGPGASSLMGLFLENGPLIIKRDIEKEFII